MDRRTFVRTVTGATCISLVFAKAIGKPKPVRFQLEIIASSLEDAKAALEGGATRLELAVHLEKEGFLSPPLDLIRRIVEEVPIPARIMIREREGVVLTGLSELRSLIEKEKAVAQLAINGYVLGFTKGGQIDLPTLRQLISAVPSAHCTVHNAIEMTTDPLQTLASLKTLRQIDRALVCGCSTFQVGNQVSLENRMKRLKVYKDLWEGDERRLLVNGLTVDELKRVQREVGIREFHLGSQVRTPEADYPVGKVDARKVRDVVKLLSSL